MLTRQININYIENNIMLFISIKKIIPIFILFFIPFYGMAQEIKFQNLSQCVDFDPGGRKVDCRQGHIQIIYNSKNHYSLRGFYGLSTTYERFQENCKHPKNLKSLVEIIDNYKYHFDFICYNEKNRWLLFVRFDKTNGKLISSDELDYFTCSNLNYNYVIRELVSKFGDGTTPIKYGASSEKNFQDRLKNYDSSREEIYRSDSKSEMINAWYVFDSNIHPLLNCPGGIVLNINIKMNPDLRRSAEREYWYILNKPGVK